MRIKGARFSLLFIFAVVFLIVLPSFAIAGKVKQDLSDIIKTSAADENVRVIIKFKDKPSITEMNLIKSEGANVKKEFNLVKAASATMKARDIEKIAARDSVDLIEPDYVVKVVMDNSAKQINAPQAWNHNITGKNVNVAVIDTGISNTNPYLKVLKEYDFIGEGTDDLNGHGTHVAGTIASIDSTYRGIAYEANLMDAKVLNQYGSGYSTDVMNGIEWAVANGADVISLSLGASIRPCDGSDSLSQMVDSAVDKGVVAVVAAGNSGPGNGTIDSPGCSKKALTVGASYDTSDAIASFSSRGPTGDGRIKPDVVAPGVYITSTWPDGTFKSLSGTSMATPHVSGVAALVMQSNSSLSAGAVKQRIMATTKDLGLDKNTQGAGRVDAYNAIAINITNEPNVTNTSAKIKISQYYYFPSQTAFSQGESFTIISYIKNTGDADSLNSMATLGEWQTSVFSIDTPQKIIQQKGQIAGTLTSGSEVEVTWTVKPVNITSNYSRLRLYANSSNGGFDVALIPIELIVPQITNNTNQTKNVTSGNRTKNNTKIPPGISKKKTLPKGLVDKAGTTPSSTLAYRLKRIGESMSLFFIFNKEDKLNKKIEIAEKRLAEAAVMSEQGKDEHVKELVKDYEQNLEEAKGIAKEMKKEFGATGLEDKIRERNAKNLEILQVIEEKAPQEAKPLLAVTISSAKRDTARAEKKEAAAEAKVAQAEERKTEMIQKAAEKTQVKETTKVDKAASETKENKNEERKSESSDSSQASASPVSTQTMTQTTAPATTSSESSSTNAVPSSSASASTSTASSSSSTSSGESSSASASSGSTGSSSASSAPSSSGSNSNSGSISTSSSSSSSSQSGSSSASSGSSSSGSSSSNSGSSSSGGSSSGNNGGNSGNNGRGNGATGEVVGRMNYSFKNFLIDFFTTMI